MQNNIKLWRVKLGMSQAELAEKSGISRTTLSHLETDPNAVSTSKTLFKIARALETTVDHIFFEQCD